MSATLPERIFADLTEAAAADTEAMAWIASPSPGVERKPLDRDGGEVARATSVVRYAAGSRFAPHRHERGEEFLVLDGVFADEHGRYPAGTYVRNPPGSAHAPFSDEGCTILVKLRQMPDADRQDVVIDTNAAPWVPARVSGHWRQSLYASAVSTETVGIERLAPGTAIAPRRPAGGEEIFVLEGSLLVDGAMHRRGAWIRRPAGDGAALASPDGCRFWVKRGHLPARP
jgi:quercetin dioxygenase-like cupin family protein